MQPTYLEHSQHAPTSSGQTVLYHIVLEAVVGEQGSPSEPAFITPCNVCLDTIPTLLFSNVVLLSPISSNLAGLGGGSPGPARHPTLYEEPGSCSFGLRCTCLLVLVERDARNRGSQLCGAAKSRDQALNLTVPHSRHHLLSTCRHTA